MGMGGGGVTDGREDGDHGGRYFCHEETAGIQQFVGVCVCVCAMCYSFICLVF